ncbi:MAG TPA: DUF4870 domain-containing protein [Rhizomicrobium sp.]
MVDVPPSPQPSPLNSAIAVADSERGTVILAYILFLIGWPTGHLSTIVAVILAYVKRGEVRGTIWETHYDNIINTFWVTMVLGIVCVALCFVLIGIPLIIALGVWFLYRSIKGLIRAVDNRSYEDAFVPPASQP